MLLRSLMILSLILVGIGQSDCLKAQDAPVFKSGAAERDITPEIGMEEPGGYGKSYHRTLHDPCKVRAVVFADENKRVVIVSIDAIAIRRDTVLSMRKRIEAETGIPGEAVMIHATHSHSSGPLAIFLPGDFDGESDFVKSLAYEHSTNADPKYVKRVENQTVDAVVEANTKAVPSKCSVGSGHEDKVSFNRRFFMQSGIAFTHPGVGNPGIIEPAGPIDPEVGVIGSWNEEGQLTSCVVNFSCHATTSPGGTSASYPYYIEQVLRGVFGQQVIVVFLAGASGDVTQVDNRAKEVSPKPEQWAKLVGGSIGAEAVKVLFQTEPGDLTPLAYRSKTWTIPRRKPSEIRLKKAIELAKQSQQAVGHAEWTFAKETVLLDAILRKEPEAEVEVQAIQVGPVLLVSDPAEFFCELGLEIKKGSPFRYTFPVSLANGCVGYVPTPAAFGERGGGYETRLTSYSNLEVNAGQQIVDVSVELAKQFTPGAVPSRPAPPPFQDSPWSYGSVPPQVE
ncbi:hypothetical protein SH668x_000430 [Planctomicrobium sp. SH668]|uniref:hypothetical protein n=1 Tax=Planctomicrobium sp. SH668 TaxID=3448126 RepID=UPI003F5B267F